MRQIQDSVYAFGPFRFNADARVLARDGQAVRLTPKAADLLVALIGGGGRVVSKDDLIARVWPDAFVEDGSLTFQVNQLRQALGETKTGPRYIETVPRRGYRFVAPVSLVSIAGESLRAPGHPGAPFPPQPDWQEHVTTVAATEPVPKAAPIDPRPARVAWRRAWVASAALAVAVAVLVVGATDAEPPLPSVVRVHRLTRDGQRKADLLALD